MMNFVHLKLDTGEYLPVRAAGVCVSESETDRALKTTTKKWVLSDDEEKKETEQRMLHENLSGINKCLSRHHNWCDKTGEKIKTKQIGTTRNPHRKKLK